MGRSEKRCANGAGRGSRLNPELGSTKTGIYVSENLNGGELLSLKRLKQFTARVPEKEPALKTFLLSNPASSLHHPHQRTLALTYGLHSGRLDLLDLLDLLGGWRLDLPRRGDLLLDGSDVDPLAWLGSACWSLRRSRFPRRLLLLLLLHLIPG